MSTTSLNTIQKDIEAYLAEQVSDGQQYFKSKYIAEDLDLSPKTVGTNMGILQDKTDQIDIEHWSGTSSGVTWLVSLNESPPMSSQLNNSDSQPAYSAD